MDKDSLDKKLNVWVNNLPQKDRKFLFAHLSSLKSVYPFNEYEYRLMYLLEKETISFNEYEALRNNYVNSKPYANLYGLAPRTFGGKWAEQHLVNIDNRFMKPSKKIDKNYSGEYDLYLNKGKALIKIEVKASRATHTQKGIPLEEKALSYNSKDPFWMNFQQLKLNIVDAFVFIGVWTDKIQYWVLSNKEVKEHPTRTHQHRGGIEYQIFITPKNLKAFDQFLVQESKLVDSILKKVCK